MISLDQLKAPNDLLNSNLAEATDVAVLLGRFFASVKIYANQVQFGAASAMIVPADNYPGDDAAWVNTEGVTLKSLGASSQDSLYLAIRTNADDPTTYHDVAQLRKIYNTFSEPTEGLIAVLNDFGLSRDQALSEITADPKVQTAISGVVRFKQTIGGAK